MKTPSLFDPHIHMTSRTTDDYEAMARAGVRAVLEPSSWLGQPRTNAGSFADHFASLVGWERFRANQFGIRHYCALALSPREANDESLARDVLEMLPRFLVKEGVVAVGMIGLDEQTSAEEDAFVRQLDIAKRAKLPVLVHTPQRDKKRAAERTLAILREVAIAPEMVVVDQSSEETAEKVLDAGHWAGFSICPNTKLDPSQMASIALHFGKTRVVVDSAADWGVSDPLAVAKASAEMLRVGLAFKDVEAILWQNPIAFFAQSERITAEDFEHDAAIDQRGVWQGNSVLRGQTPRVGSIA